MAHLDHRCEVWLSKTFGLCLDFAIESTLPTLVEEGLIQEHQSGNEVMLDISIQDLAPACFRAAAAPSCLDRPYMQQLRRFWGIGGAGCRCNHPKMTLQALSGLS